VFSLLPESALNARSKDLFSGMAAESGESLISCMLIFCIVNLITSSPDAIQTNPTIVVKHSDYGGLLK